MKKNGFILGAGSVEHERWLNSILISRPKKRLRALIRNDVVMPNAPFQVAFWALLFALGTIITISVTDPNGMPLTALTQPKPNVDSENPTVSNAEPMLADVNTIQSESAPAAESFQPTLDPAYANTFPTEPIPQPRSTPIQVASADPNARLNLAPTEKQPTGLEPIVDSPLAPHPVPDERIAINIPVPIPVPEMYRNQNQEPTPEHAVPSEERVATLVAQAVNIDEWSARIAQRQQSSFDQLSEKIDTNVASLRSDISDLKAATESVEEPTIETNSSIDVSISPGETEGQWTFEFQKADLPDVFRTLGQHAGWAVVVSPEVQGKLTATFSDANPEQAFAVVVKNHQCTVNRRGDYILVSPRSN